MVRPRCKIKAICQNEGCSHFRREEGKNIIKKGKNLRKHQRYFCFHCDKYFVETKGTPLYRRKLNEKKIKKLCEEFVETKGIRALERTIKIHRDTIGSYLSAFAEHAKEMSKYLTKEVGLSSHELDEFWTFVKKSKKKLSPIATKNLLQEISGGLQR